MRAACSSPLTCTEVSGSLSAAAAKVSPCFSIVLPILYGDAFDTAGTITTGIEIGATICFFATITDAVGDCNSELERHTDTLLLSRLLSYLAGTEGVQCRSYGNMNHLVMNFAFSARVLLRREPVAPIVAASAYACASSE